MSLAVRSIALCALSLPGACSASTEGGVEVTVIASPSEVAAGSTFETADGVPVRLDALGWTYSALELVPCRSAAGRLLDVIVPAAYAHGATTPTRLAVPVVQSLTSTHAVPVGTLRPPATRYCAVSLTLDAADDDAEGLLDNPNMSSKSLELRGELGEPSGDLRELASSTSAAASARVALELDLTSVRSVVLSISREPEGWFAVVNAETLAGPGLAEVVLRNFAASTVVRAE